MAVDGPADEHPIAARGADGHQRRLGHRRRAVVVRSGNDVQAGQLSDQRLILVDGLQRALADLRLVRRIRGIELAPAEDLVDGGRDVVAIGAGTQEAGQPDPIARSERLHAHRQRQLVLCRRQVEAVGPDRGRNILEQRVD